MFNTMRIFARDAFQSIRRNSVMSIASILSVVCALIIIGIILALAINVNYITSQVEDNLELKIYLNETIPDLTKESLYTSLVSNEHVSSAVYESKAQALQNFKDSLDGNDYLLSGITEENSPIPASYIVTVDDPSNMEEVYQFSLTLDGVGDVIYSQETVDKLTRFNSLVNMVSWAVLAVLSVIAIFIIYNTIKLTVFSRRNEISIMKYVGATNNYIRCPFIIEGTFLGLLGALISILLMRNIYYFLSGVMQGSMSILSIGGSIAPPAYVISRVSIYYAIYGVLLGALGSSFSLKKFLHV